ncbi:MAG TPA: mechanosensitive ion channel domain-containing protein [Opitutus sp.]|nr:mechanosensitive ion channel domain-containing protein [Opitutus sp.]
MNYDLQNLPLREIAESGLIAIVAVFLFFGLKGRMQVVGRMAHIPEFAFRPIRIVIRYIILVGGALLALGVWGFPVNGVIAVMGTLFGLVAIGFVAVWSVLSNFLCTFVLIMFRPFSVGDEVELVPDGVKGHVVDLTMLFTTLQVSRGETVMIPNNIFFQRVFKRRRGQNTVDLHAQLERTEPHEMDHPAA